MPDDLSPLAGMSPGESWLVAILIVGTLVVVYAAWALFLDSVRKGEHKIKKPKSV